MPISNMNNVGKDVTTDNPELELMKEHGVPAEETGPSPRVNIRGARILRRSKRRANREVRGASRANIIKRNNQEIPDLTDTTQYL